jgi:hypothetical protein
MNRDHAEAVDLHETRRRFLLAREQAAQSSAERYRAVRRLREWPLLEGDVPTP